MGVKYRHNGKVLKVKARKEVIVSGGTVGSAKLLLLSGVGPRNHLQSLKVTNTGFIESSPLLNVQTYIWDIPLCGVLFVNYSEDMHN